MSGADAEIERGMAMDLYRKRAGKRDEDGVMQFSPPFKYVDAAEFLSNEPKFSDRYSDMRSSVPGERSVGSGDKDEWIQLHAQHCRNRKADRKKLERLRLIERRLLRR